MTRVFADTSYFIAVIAPNDVAHERAQTFAGQSLRLVTTAFVMTELAAYLSAPANRPLFNRLLASVRSNPAIDFIPATQQLFDEAATLYASRQDKRGASWIAPPLSSCNSTQSATPSPQIPISYRQASTPSSQTRADEWEVTYAQRPK